MTIETLIHIYSLLKADEAKKAFALQCENTKRDRWLENTDTPWQQAEAKYPEEREYRKAYDDHRTSENALEEFKVKEWN